MRIALLGDTHYPDIGTHAPYDAIKERYFTMLWDRFFETEADIYVQLGDLTEHGSPDALSHVMETIRAYDAPFYLVTGNHDLHLSTRAEIRAITGQPDVMHVTHHGVHILILYSPHELDLVGWGGGLDPEQRRLLQNVIRDTEGEDLVVLCHHGVYDTGWKTDREHYFLEPRHTIQDILESRRTPAVFVNGHGHMDSIVVRGPWHYIQLPNAYDDPIPRVLTFGAKAISVAPADDANSEILRGFAHTVAEHFWPKVTNKDNLGPSHQRTALWPRLDRTPN